MQKTKLKKQASNGSRHNGAAHKSKLSLLKKINNNAKYIVAKSLIKARRESAPVRYFLRSNPAKTASLTLIAGLVGGFCAGYLVDKSKRR